MTTAGGIRARLVTEQNGKQHVSSVVLSLEEVAQSMEAEEMLHRAAGWHVERYGASLRAERADCLRWIWPRLADPMEDVL